MSTAVVLPRPGAAASRFRFLSKELVLWLGLYPVYLAIRGLSIDSYATALGNAHLISLERSLPLFPEASLQDVLSPLHGLLAVGLAAGHDTGSFGGVLPFNPYAAMPSMHVGWSLLVGIFGFRALHGNALRWVFALHPVVMVVAVSATGNHYFLDAAAGAVVILGALAAIRLFNRNHER